MRKQAGVGVAMIGLLIAAYDLAEIAAKPFFGFLADKYDMRKSMLSGIVIFTLASLLYLFVDPGYLILVRFLQGLGAAGLSAVSLALIGVYFRDDRGKAYGIYNAIKGLGYVISPILGGWLVLQVNFASIFPVSAFVGVVAFLISRRLPSTEALKGKLDDEDELSIKAFIAVFKDPDLIRWYTVIVVNMFFIGILFGFLPVRIASSGYDSLTTGTYLTLVAISFLSIQPLAGWLSDKMEIVPTIGFGLLLSGISLILIPFVSGTALAAVSILAGIGTGTVWTNTDNLISWLAKDGRLGVTMGAAGSFKELGEMLGPILIGIVSQALGLTAGFIICGTLGLLSLGLIWTKNAAVTEA